MIERDPLAALQAENARLIALLDGRGIEWRLTPQPIPPEPAPPAPEPESSRLSTAEKVTLFRRLFRGRTDVYPIRWESKTTGKSGYAVDTGHPALLRMWEKRQRGYRAMGYRMADERGATRRETRAGSRDPAPLLLILGVHKTCG